MQMLRNVDSFNRDLSSTNVVRLRDTAIDKAGFLPLRSHSWLTGVVKWERQVNRQLEYDMMDALTRGVQGTLMMCKGSH